MPPHAGGFLKHICRKGFFFPPSWVIFVGNGRVANPFTAGPFPDIPLYSIRMPFSNSLSYFINSESFDGNEIMMIPKRRVLVIVLLAGMAVATLSSCSNTFNGFGQDMEKNGEAIQRQF